MMRLLMTADSVGGVWTYALDLADGLAAHSIETTLAVLGPPPDATQRAQAAAVSGLELRDTALPLDWLATGPEAVLDAGDAIADLARTIGADLVHLNTPALAAGGAFGVPVVATCHSCVRTWWRAVYCQPLPPAFAWQAELVARGYAACAALVAPTQSFADATQLAYGLRRPPVTVHNGRRRITAATQIGTTSQFVFTAGRLWDAGKNLGAVDRLAAKIPWPVVAAGATVGPDGSQVALPNIRTLGRLDAKHLAKCLAARPLFLSLARYEPFGLAVLEAAQAGCPLILSDIASFRELWQGAAIFVPPDDTDAVFQAVGRIMRDPTERDHLGRRAATRAARFTMAAMVDGMAEIFKPLVARGARQALGAA